MSPIQDEPAVSDLRRGRAVRDGERIVAEEALTLGKVREGHYLLNSELKSSRSQAAGSDVFVHAVTGSVGRARRPSPPVTPCLM